MQMQRLPQSPPGPRFLPILLGGLVVAAGDATFAVLLWFPLTLAGVERMFQSIAVGVLGTASFDRGATSALLGAALHLAMATTFVLVFTALAWRWPRLSSRPLLHGAAYGALLYVAMNFIVMPLSRVGHSPSFDHPGWIILSALVHLPFGMVCALAARRALRGNRVAGLVPAR